MVAQGLRNKAVAERLDLKGTVKVHLHNVYEKSGWTAGWNWCSVLSRRGSSSYR